MMAALELIDEGAKLAAGFTSAADTTSNLLWPIQNRRI
jgi:hypothetical protein